MWKPGPDYEGHDHDDRIDKSDHAPHPYRSLLREKFDSIRGCDCHVCRIVDSSALEEWSIGIERKLKRMKIFILIVTSAISTSVAAAEIIRLLI